MTSLKSVAMIHVVLALVSGIALFAGGTMAILKLAEIGAGPSFSWSTITIAFGVGVVAVIGAVYNMFRGFE